MPEKFLLELLKALPLSGSGANLFVNSTNENMIFCFICVLAMQMGVWYNQ